MTYRFADLVDIAAVQSLMERLWEAAGLPVGIIDVDGTVLVATGWQDICTVFHRRHPLASQRCRESDAYIQRVLVDRGPLPEGEYVAYRCRNGLLDIAVPILIEGRHLATLFLGQFLYESPEEHYFIAQAREFGFPQEEYLAALRRVPTFSPEKVGQIIAFHSRLVSLLARMGAETLRRITAQQEMDRREQVLCRQNEAFLHLGMLRALGEGDFPSLLREVLQTAGRTLEVERTGYWQFTEDRRHLRCLGLFQRSADRHSTGPELEVSRFPAYFQAIEEEKSFACHHVEVDPRTRELLEVYLRPAGISSMLDTSVWRGGRLVGIFCCEHVGRPRCWSYEEQNFAGSMADLISLALAGNERWQAERALREAEKKYRLLFSAESDAILILDAETRKILEVNEAATLLYGYGQEEFSFLGLEDILADPAQAESCLSEGLTGGRSRIPLFQHRKRDGTVFPAETSSGAFVWQGRRRLVAIVRDITERQQIMRLKDDLLSTVSHEIRTPLTAILGFADYLRNHPLPPAQQGEYLDIICAEGERLKDLTDNLLDLQRWRAGFGTEGFAAVHLRLLLQSVCHLFRQASARHRLAVDCDPELPPVFGDEKQLYRALQNLVANAIKYSPEGGRIILGGRREGEFAHLWVSDEGVGIPPEAQEQIFERFFRLDTGKQWIGGTGLGLALVKAVVQGHRGRVWVESTVGRGSTFHLAIPLCSVWQREEDDPPAVGAG